MRAPKKPNRRTYISEKSEQLVDKIKNKSARHYLNKCDVIEAALELLWEHEKTLAINLLVKNEQEFYEEHPGEKDYLSKTQGFDE